MLRYLGSVLIHTLSKSESNTLLPLLQCALAHDQYYSGQSPLPKRKGSAERN